MVIIGPPEGTEPSPKVKQFVERAERVCLLTGPDPELPKTIADFTSEAIEVLSSLDETQRRWLYYLSSENIEEFNPRFNAVMTAANHVVREVLTNE